MDWLRRKDFKILSITVVLLLFLNTSEVSG